VLSRHPPWADALAAWLDPRLAGLLLLHAPQRLPLLVYLQQQGLANRLELADAVDMGQVKAHQTLGEEWVRWSRRQRGRAPGRGAAGARLPAAARAVWAAPPGTAAEAEAEAEAKAEPSAAAAAAEGVDEEAEAWGTQEEASEGAPMAPSPDDLFPSGADDGCGTGGGGSDGGAGGSGADDGGGGVLSVAGGVVVGWPGHPSVHQRLILRQLWAADGMYPPETRGLVDSHWKGQPWWQAEPGSGPAP
jgi:hypothetical protein